jgi:hypothetical protein
MPQAGRPSRSATILALLLVLASAAAFLALADLRDSFTTVRGDEGTYLAMAESLALDGDLRLEAADVERLVAAADPGRQAVILQQVESGDFYSKPALYPLLAAPFYRVLGGASGLVALNLLALAAALGCAWLYLRRFDADRALLTLVSFAGAGALLAYVAWRTSDLVQVAAVLAGLALCLGPLPRRGLGEVIPRAVAARPLFAGPGAALLGGLLLGLAGSLRITNLVMAGAPLLALWLHGQRRRAGLVALGVAAALLTGAASNWALAGATSPYRTTRATFDTASGYPSAEATPTENRYETSYSKVRIRSPRLRPAVSAYAALYFLVGRHSGLLLYSPVALLLLAASLRRLDRTGGALWLAAGGLSLLYLLWLPHNYFGGGACIGNRYFLVAYAALPFLGRPLGWRGLSPAWLLAALAFGSAFHSQRTAGELDRSSQGHAHAGVFRWLPYESTAENIEGSRERFWPKEDWELIHFADPYARVGDWSFELATGAPTEIEVANRRPGAALRFLVNSPARRLRLMYRDWGKSEEIELRRPFGHSGLVEIEPSPAWRRHPLWFWWQLRDAFHIRLFTLEISTPDGSPAQAEVRYLGSMELPNGEFYRRTVLRGDLPEIAPPGGASAVPIEVRNDGDRPWLSGDVLPVHLGHRLACPGILPTEGRRLPLPATVMPGEVLSITLDVQWPEVEGECSLTVDLVVEGVSWFEAETGAPLVSGVVSLSSAPVSSDTPSSQPIEPTATPNRRMSRERSGGAGAGSR